jgi:tRNA (guanine-N7-)-methyltransferase
MTTEHRDDRDSHDLRSYGRKRVRKPSARQAQIMADVLPLVAVDLSADASSPESRLFPTQAEPVPGMPPGEAVRDIWLEIGFGGGEHLLWQARRHPDVGFIGCEPFEDGVVKVLTAIHDGKLPNVRVLADDVRPLLRWLPDATIGRAFILFPDPWPKKRHAKRRLFSQALLHDLARVMRSGAELRLATDIGDYARTALFAIAKSPEFDWPAPSPEDWRNRRLDWPETRYELKAVREGRQRYFFTFLRM